MKVNKLFSFHTSKKGRALPFFEVLALFFLTIPLKAQTPSDALMMPSKNICVLFLMIWALLTDIGKDHI